MVSKLDKRNAKDIKETFHNLSQSGSYGSYYQKDKWREKAMRDAYSKEADKGEDLLAVRDERKTEERRAKSTRKKVLGNTAKKIGEVVCIVAASLCFVTGIGVAAEHFSSNQQIKQEVRAAPIERRLEEEAPIKETQASAETSIKEGSEIQILLGKEASSFEEFTVQSNGKNTKGRPTSMKMSAEEKPTVGLYVGTPDSSVKQKPTIQVSLEAVQTEPHTGVGGCGNTHVATKGTVAVIVPLDKGNSR